MGREVSNKNLWCLLVMYFFKTYLSKTPKHPFHFNLTILSSRPSINTSSLAVCVYSISAEKLLPFYLGLTNNG